MDEPVGGRHFCLDVDVTALSGDIADELGRILRYWAGNLKHYQLDQPVSEAVYDSQYQQVGSWSVT